jgi:formate hydrogenlyase transcriptional activator
VAPEKGRRSAGAGARFIGKSSAMRAVFKQIEIVAPTDAAVLILGETGTGKELVARAIHNLSARRNRNMEKLNCAAIPAGLCESELFGHERGSFTGAVMRKIGRFELAHEGSLFLDEIGDFPRDLQPKLLRVLQEREFERLGASRTQQVDVRLVAATSRNLPQMVADGVFRSELFYRINVFPIRLPALRERAPDIPLLVWHFVEQYSSQLNRKIDSIPQAAMDVLKNHAWPGNVRELQNFIQRAVILSPGRVLNPPLEELEAPHSQHASWAGRGIVPGVETLQQHERHHILQALEHSRWLIGGRHGAATLLGLKRTTLLSRMKKLGIARRPDLAR